MISNKPRFLSKTQLFNLQSMRVELRDQPKTLPVLTEKCDPNVEINDWTVGIGGATLEKNEARWENGIVERKLSLKGLLFNRKLVCL